MTIEEALKAHLNSSVTLVSNRVYPVVLPPAATLPALAYLKVSNVPLYAHDGDAGLPAVRFQFDIWASTYSSLQAVKAQLMTALSGYRGTMGGVGGVTVGSSFLVGEQDDYEPETSRYREMLDFIIQYRT